MFVQMQNFLFQIFLGIQNKYGVLPAITCKTLETAHCPVLKNLVKLTGETFLSDYHF